MSNEVSSELRQKPELFVREYLRLVDEGWEPDLEEYLHRVPDPVREEVFQQIDEELEQRSELSWETEEEERVEIEAEPECEPPPPEVPQRLDPELEPELEPEPSSVVEAPLDVDWPTVEGFRVEKELGRGTLGSTYRAWDESEERPVVLKVVDESVPDRVLDRVMKEAERVTEAGIPGVFGFERRLGRILVAPDLDGVPVHATDRGIEPLADLARLLAQLHAAGLAHLDLKPNNVLVTPEGVPVLLDFGVAVHAPLAGLPHYESPEHANRLRIDASSDVWSFGVLLYRVLTGKLPFPGGAPEKVRERIEEAEPMPPRLHDEAIAPELQDIILSCFTRRASERPTMRELAAELERFLTGQPVHLRPRYYRDILRRRVRDVTTEVRAWEAQGLARARETEQLEALCRRILAREEHWTHDVSRVPARVRLAGIGMALFLVAALLSLRLGLAHLSPVAWIAPLAASAALLAAGVAFAAKQARHAATPLLWGGLGGLVVSLAATFQGTGLMQGTATAFPGLAWLQLAAASGVGLLASIGLLSWRRECVFAWTTCAAVVLTALGSVGVFSFFGLGVAALLPLALLLVVARQFDLHDRYDWARPFFWSGLVALLGAPAAAAFLPASPLPAPLAFAALGVGLIAAGFLFARTESYALRTTARAFRLLSPGLLLGGLCVQAHGMQAPLAWGGPLVASIVLIAYGIRMRNRVAYGWGLVGLLATAAWPALSGFVTPWTYAMLLGILGLASTAILTWGIRPRREP